jgi:hypothetical protein
LRVDEADSWGSNNLTEDSVEFHYNIINKKNVYIRYPENIFSGLAKIGGLFALIKLVSLIIFYHKHLFENEMKIQQSFAHHSPQQEIQSKNKLNFSYDIISMGKSNSETTAAATQDMKEFLSNQTFFNMNE